MGYQGTAGHRRRTNMAERAMAAVLQPRVIATDIATSVESGEMMACGWMAQVI